MHSDSMLTEKHTILYLKLLTPFLLNVSVIHFFLVILLAYSYLFFLYPIYVMLLHVFCYYLSLIKATNC